MFSAQALTLLAATLGGFQVAALGFAARSSQTWLVDLRGLALNAARGVFAPGLTCA
jgi:hypothetical protein